MATRALYNRSFCVKQACHLPAKKTMVYCVCVLIVCFLTLCFHGSSFAADVTLQWDANSEPDLAGYKIYYGNFSGEPYDGIDAAEGNSPVTITLEDLDDHQNPKFELSELDDGEIYYVVLTAFDAENLESNFSNEVSTENSGSGTGLTVGATSGGGGCFINAITDDSILF